MYEMVAGYPPFQQEDRVAMFRAICATQFTSPSHFSKAREARGCWLAGWLLAALAEGCRAC